MREQTKRFYKFGPFRLDTAERLLRRNDETVPLTPKAYEERDYRIVIIHIDPIWDDLRSDPRFADLMGRVGLANN